MVQRNNTFSSATLQNTRWIQSDHQSLRQNWAQMQLKFLLALHFVIKMALSSCPVHSVLFPFKPDREIHFIQIMSMTFLFI